MGYVATRLVNLDGELFEAGAAIAFSEKQAKAKAELLECGAVAGKTAKTETAERAGKTIGEMSKAELEAIAAAEGVDLQAANNNADRASAIKAHRLAAAAANDGGAATE